jgi:hypothetical protein
MNKLTNLPLDPVYTNIIHAFSISLQDNIS